MNSLAQITCFAFSERKPKISWSIKLYYQIRREVCLFRNLWEQNEAKEISAKRALFKYHFFSSIKQILLRTNSTFCRLELVRRGLTFCLYVTLIFITFIFKGRKCSHLVCHCCICRTRLTQCETLKPHSHLKFIFFPSR